MVDFKYTMQKNLLNSSGIYCITNLTNNKKYVGSSIDMYYRIASHKSKLLKNKHDNIYLQRAFNIDGIDNFEINILEFCSEENLAVRELFWMKFLNVEYNLCEVTAPRKNKVSIESRIKISTTNLNKTGITSITMLDKISGEDIKNFNSLVEAAKYIKDTYSYKSTEFNMRCKISVAARFVPIKEKAFTAFGYKWRYNYAM